MKNGGKGAGIAKEGVKTGKRGGGNSENGIGT